MYKTDESLDALQTELNDLDRDADCERVEEIERALKFTEDGIEYFLTKDKRKAHSFKIVRRLRQRGRVRELLDSLNQVSDSEDEE